MIVYEEFMGDDGLPKVATSSIASSIPSTTSVTSRFLTRPYSTPRARTMNMGGRRKNPWAARSPIRFARPNKKLPKEAVMKGTLFAGISAAALAMAVSGSAAWAFNKIRPPSSRRIPLRSTGSSRLHASNHAASTALR